MNDFLKEKDYKVADLLSQVDQLHNANVSLQDKRTEALQEAQDWKTMYESEKEDAEEWKKEYYGELKVVETLQDFVDWLMRKTRYVRAELYSEEEKNEIINGIISENF